jgi:predicted transglutaminase-like cysteine proteinase
MFRLWVLLGIWACVCFMGAAPAWASNPILGSREAQKGRITQFAKWVDMLQRPDGADPTGRTLPNSRLANSGGCVPNPRVACARPDWESLTASLAGGDRRTQIIRVNEAINRYRYVTDPENWGLPDYWATVRQFLRRDGDCEDYAIAKYMTLKRLGVPVEQMRVVVLNDLNLGVPHAVLAVFLDTETLILDNQIQTVLPDSAIAHYQPIYSINEHAWWLLKPMN